MKINSKAELVREIKKTASEYSAEELFSSPYFYNYLSSVISACCASLNRTPSIKAFYDSESNFTAATEGTTVSINTAGPLIREMPTYWEQYVNMFGHITHECGHVLFTDFTSLNPLRQKWSTGKFEYFPNTPHVNGAEEFKDYLNTHPNYRKIYTTVMNEIVNIMEDVYIENRLYECFDGLCAAGLHKSNDEKYRLAACEEEIFAYVLLGQAVPLSAAAGIMQLRKLGYESKVQSPVETWPQPFKDVRTNIYNILDEVDDILNQLSTERVGIVRCELFNELFVKLRPLLPEMDNNEDYSNSGSSENQQSGEGEGQGGSGNGDYSNEETEKYAQGSKAVHDRTGVSQEPQGETSAINTEEMSEEEREEKKQNADKYSKSEDICKSELEKAKNEAAKDECENECENEHNKDLQNQAHDINEENKKSSKCRGYQAFKDFEVFRKSSDSATQYASMYMDIYQQIAKTSKSLQRKITSILKDREVESEESGYLFGQKLNAQDIVHRDGKYFSRYNEPDGKLRVCFGVLVDESGSMGGGNDIVARRASILLEDCLRNLNVPLLLVGHTTNSRNVLLKPYVDFGTLDNKDRYRLCGIGAWSGNIDGAAITYMRDRLLKRPEEIKVLIVISDGLPAGVSYYDIDSDKDTMMAIESCRKKGMKVFGAVVDSWEQVSRLYGDEFSFNCTENHQLETQLIKLIKRYVLIK